MESMERAAKDDTGEPGVFSALSARSFRMYWSGAFISSIGSWLQVTAVLWIVKENGSNTLVGFVNMVNWLPCLLLGLFTGAIADRFDRRRLILVTQAVMMFCSILIGVCLHTSLQDLVLIVFLGISGIAYAVFVSTWVSTIPFLVTREKLLSAVTLNAFQFNLAKFIGPTAAGLLLVATTDFVPFFLNALTFGAFIVLILLAKADLPGPEQKRENILLSVIEGFRYLRGNRWAAVIIASICGLSFFGFSIVVLMPAICKSMLKVNDHYYGFLVGMTGLGAVAGMALVAMLENRAAMKTIMFVGALLTAAFIVGLAFSKLYWLSCIMAFGAGGSFLVFLSVANAAIQRNVVPGMQGRISGMFVVAFTGIFPLGGLLLGYLADVLSLQSSLFIAGLSCVAMAFIIILFVEVPGGE